MMSRKRPTVACGFLRTKAWRTKFEAIFRKRFSFLFNYAILKKRIR